jgi:hypothetical protein
MRCSAGRKRIELGEGQRERVSEGKRGSKRMWIVRIVKERISAKGMKAWKLPPPFSHCRHSSCLDAEGMWSCLLQKKSSLSRVM